MQIDNQDSEEILQLKITLPEAIKHSEILKSQTESHISVQLPMVDESKASPSEAPQKNILTEADQEPLLDLTVQQRNLLLRKNIHEMQ
jgi:hypothetical protein